MLKYNQIYGQRYHMKIKQFQRTRGNIEITISLIENDNRQEVIIITLFNYERWCKYYLEINKELKDLPAIFKLIPAEQFYQQIISKFNEITFHEDGSMVFTIGLMVDRKMVHHTIYLKALEKEMNQAETIREKFLECKTKLQATDKQVKSLKKMLVQLAILLIFILCYSFFKSQNPQNNMREQNVQQKTLKNFNNLQINN